MLVRDNHLMLIVPWGPRDGEEAGGSTTNASSTQFGPFDVGEAIRFSSDVDFHYVMGPLAPAVVATVSHQVHRSNWFPLELTIENGFEYISVINSTSTGTLWAAPLHPALNKTDKDA